MRLLVTGSAGHQAIGLDIKRSPFTHHVGSIADRAFVSRCLCDVDAVLQGAMLHKPHGARRSRRLEREETDEMRDLESLEAVYDAGP